VRIALPTLVNAGLTTSGRRDELVTLVTQVIAQSRADLVVLPELSVSGYPELVDAERDDAILDEVSEPVDGPAGRAFGVLAAETGCAIVYGISERSPDSSERFNSLVWAEPDGTLTGYRKMHLTSDERRHWTPGEHIGLAHSRDGVVGLSACNDKAFAEIYEVHRAAGARLSVIASAWSSHPGSPEVAGDVWAEQSELFDRSRAAETAMVVASTNYHGPKAPGSTANFCDGRRVVDPLGRLQPVTQEYEFGPVWDVDLAAASAGVDHLHGSQFFGRQSTRTGRDTSTV